MPAPRAKNRRAGPRTKLLTFYSVSTATQDASGATSDTETSICTAWASLKTISGNESWVPPQVSGTATHSILTDYFAGLTTKHRIGLGSRRFDIVLVNNMDEADWQYEIFAKEAV